MPFKIVRNDITKVTADAIVNTANPNPVIGSGTDSAVYKAAGAELVLDERRHIGRIARGDADFTHAYFLPAKYIIHTVGPSWIDGNHGERDILRNCYTNSLQLAEMLKCQSVAFPLIATGNYGFPKDEALNIALSEIGRFLLTHDMDVTLVVFDIDSFRLSKELFGDIEQYIGNYETLLLKQEEYIMNYDEMTDEEREELEKELMRLSGYEPEESFGDSPAPGESKISADSEIRSEDIDDSVRFSIDTDIEERPPKDEERVCYSIKESNETEKDDLDRLLRQRLDSFRDMLFRLIDESGMTDVQVYKSANIDRKLFSSIRCRDDYKPKKETAIALAIALKLNIETTESLLSRAGFALSYSSKFDLIIRYFISKQNYDIMEINAALFKYGQPLLGL